MLEIENVLKLFKKEKILGPDGWTVDLFLYFLNIMGEYLLAMVEFSRTEGFVSGAVNSTFITLVPKCNKLDTSQISGI